MNSRSRELKATATTLGAVAVATISLAPIAYLFIFGISFTDIRKEFSYPATVAATWQTVVLTAIISTLTVVMGVGCAALVVRTDVPTPRLLTILFAAPLAVPGFISAYAAYSAQLVFAPRSELVTSLSGASLIMALTLYPYVFLPAVVALRSVDPALVEVASNLRPGRIARWRHAVVPSLAPAIAAGVLIVALHVLAEYGAMEQLGRSTLTTKVMAEMMDYGDYRSARSLSLVLAAMSLLVLASTAWLTIRSSTGHDVGGSRRPPGRHRLSWVRWPAWSVVLMIPLASLGPTVFMTARGLTGSHRAVSVDWTKVISALWTTLGYGVGAALIASALAFPVSWAVSRRRSVISFISERAIWVAHAAPNAVLALALVFFATRLAPSAYKTASVLVIAYVILFLPLAIGYQRVGLEASRRAYDEVAASLGARPLRTFWRITLPLSMPGFAAGAILVGLDASKELTSTLILLPFNTNTLSTRLWATTNGEVLDFTAAAPYALMLLILGLIPVYALARHALRELRVADP